MSLIFVKKMRYRLLQVLSTFLNFPLAIFWSIPSFSYGLAFERLFLPPNSGIPTNDRGRYAPEKHPTCQYRPGYILVKA